jgi:hypothetical protein
VVEQRPFKPKVVGSIPTAPTITPDDSVALALLGVEKRGRKQGVLFPSCSQGLGEFANKLMEVPEILERSVLAGTTPCRLRCNIFQGL